MITRDHAAYHEAGHAVAAALLGMRVGRVTIRPEGENGGRVEVEPVDFQAAPVGDRVKVYLAGMCGASMNPSSQGDPEACIQGAGNDHSGAVALLGDLDVPERDAYLQARCRELGDLLRQDRAERTIRRLAGMLLEREELVITADIEAAKILIHLHP